MKDGTFHVGNLILHPDMKEKDFMSDSQFEQQKNKSTTVYLTREKQKVGNMLCWLKVIASNGKITNFELRNAAETQDNQCMRHGIKNSRILLKRIRESHDSFLKERLGFPDEENNNGKEYFFSWGNIYSYMDPIAGTCGILISYAKK